ncbi:MAG: flagellar modification protein B [Anaerolinea sp.]|nr:flagellar modification protein B [Anaerolinea sp.]
MKRICTICARGGSKGVKNKNIRPLAGKPLLYYAIDQAKSSMLFDLIAVSSDSAAILDAARSHAVDLLVDRPAELASDTAAKIPAIRHCVEVAERFVGKTFDTIVDIDVTSPLRSVEDIKGAVDLLERSNVSNVITAAPARRSPYFNLVETDVAGVVRLSKPLKEPIVRRQDSPQCFDMNASIYVWKRSALFDYPTVFNADTRLFVMPEERSIDIDTELDFEIVEIIMRKRAIT